VINQDARRKLRIPRERDERASKRLARDKVGITSFVGRELVEGERGRGDGREAEEYSNSPSVRATIFEAFQLRAGKRRVEKYPLTISFHPSPSLTRGSEKESLRGESRVRRRRDRID
jgi:hypothetical protein